MANEANNPELACSREPENEQAFFRYLISLLRAEARRNIPRDLVDDVVQDTLERLLRNGRAALHRWDPKRGKAYLRRTLVNIYIDRVRASAARPERTLDNEDRLFRIFSGSEPELAAIARFRASSAT